MFSTMPASRRNVLLGLAAGGLGLPLLSACTGAPSSGSTSGGAASGTVSVGSNYSDATPKQAFADVIAAFEKSGSVKAAVNTVSHNDFQEQIDTYLQGSPDQVFTWFSGYRMRYYADKGLVAPVDDVWTKISGNFSDAIAEASTGTDGKKYLVPWVTYPWAVFYSKSLFAEKGYAPPKTWDEYVALAKQMKTDGLTPIAFAEKDGWPALGTFDYINMRLNGFEFHNSLLTNQAGWDDPKVAAVFDTWKELQPYWQEGALGLTWQESADAIVNKTAGMYVIGSDQIIAQASTTNKQDDLDFFAFPEIDPANAQDAVEAPIDGFMLSKNAAGNADAMALLEYLGSGAAQQTYLGSNVADVASATDADASKYTALQTKMVEFIGAAKHQSQFCDRDSLPTLVSSAVVPAIQTFVEKQTYDGAAMAAQAKQFWDQAS
ncbi:extracellular solute-binding protein [Micrococcales bacterium 31B]|nr:extracellular solute-binding protein [Micrococcales bacterium 31B]